MRCVDCKHCHLTGEAFYTYYCDWEKSVMTDSVANEPFEIECEGYEPKEDIRRTRKKAA